MACSQATIKSGPLYLRRLPNENQQRPIDPCTDFWRCPDIGFTNGIDAGTARGPVSAAAPPVPNTIKVTVRNASANPIDDVEVQVWVCDFGVGIGPAGARASAGGPKGVGEVPWYVGTVPGNGQASASVAWDVTRDDVTQNNGHFCIIANVYGDDVGTRIVTDPLPQQEVIFICCDSHHGWRNINVVAASMAMIKEGEERFVFPFMVGNPTADDLEGTLTVTQVQQGVLGPTERDHLLSGGLLEWSDPEQDPTCTRLLLGGDAQLPPEEQVIAHAARRELHDLGLDGDLGSGREVPFRLGRDDQVRMQIQGSFDRGTRAGEILAFDVVQHDAKGEVLSGARMLAAVGR